MTKPIPEESEEEVENRLPHPLSLPLLSTKPSYKVLTTLLQKITPPPPSWTIPSKSAIVARSNGEYNYIPWLTRIICTPLYWLTPLESDTIISLASNNLALRAGRVALPDLTRSFLVNGNTIKLFEPSWVGDSLGHKTWGTSFLLAQRVGYLKDLSGSKYFRAGEKTRCLGLGEGTGLVGIAVAKIMSWDIMLTDLPRITDNLRR